jgi:diaminohydroxyphosphoribosylaminopyrimidine deaminase/5-amino-6-(5-phosphoribosylamino)uracil reductase
MQIAFNLAKKHGGLTSSNPSVGCVVVKDGKIISSASTEINGRPHAENIALSTILDAKGGDVYVTLEPCNHFGKTPPCVNSIISAGIKRVFIAVKDTDKRVDGGGINALKSAGIQVFEGIMEEEIKEFYKPYLTAKIRHSPFVSAKIVCSSDGKIATCTGESKWISDEKSREFSNYLRHKYNGILIGTETFKKDSPKLTCRTEGLLEFSPQKFLFSNSITKAEGFTVLKGTFKKVLTKMYEDFKINHLLIEGGAGVITNAINEDVVDEILIGYTPIFIGKDGKNCVDFTGIKELINAKKFNIKNTVQFGNTIFANFTKIELDK